MNQKGKLSKRKKDPEPSIEDIYQNKHFALQKDKTLETIFEEPKVTRDGVEHFTSVKKYKRYLHFDECPTAAKLRKRRERAKKVAAVSAHYQGRLTRSRLKEPLGTSSKEDGISCSSSSFCSEISSQCSPEKRYCGSSDWNTSLPDISKCVDSELLTTCSYEENSSDEEIVINKSYKIITAEQQTHCEILTSSASIRTSCDGFSSAGDSVCMEPKSVDEVVSDVVITCDNSEVSDVQERQFPYKTLERVELEASSEKESDDKIEGHCENTVKSGMEILVPSHEKCEDKIKKAQLPQIAVEETILLSKEQEKETQKGQKLDEVVQRTEQRTSHVKRGDGDAKSENYTSNFSVSVLQECKPCFSNLSGESQNEVSGIAHQKELCVNIAKMSEMVQDSFKTLQNVKSKTEHSDSLETAEKKHESEGHEQPTEILRNEPQLVNDSKKHTSDVKQSNQDVQTDFVKS